jgi:restriction endonuclease S subunit/energy-coupling factor transporter ATP-binding protein EcfA2
MPEKLPKGWVDTTLGEIAELSRERASPVDDPAMRYVGLEHIEPHSMKLLGHSSAREARSASVRFSEGDILYGKMRPYLNKIWVAEFEGFCSAEFLVFQKQDGLNSLFLALRLNAEDFVTFANGQVSGERPRVDFAKLSSFPILLPPIAEQERIVTKLNAALSQTRRAETAARRAQERLKRYRAAVLDTAVTGEFTRAWRETPRKSKSPNSETPQALLKRLLAARRARWEEAELARLHSAGKKPKGDDWKSRYDEPTSPDTTGLPDMPPGWVWARLQQLGFVVGGLTKNPRRASLRLKLPYLRVANVYANELRLDNVVTIGVSEDEIDKLLLEEGDLLVVEGNGSKDQIGRLAIWDGSIEKCVHQNHIIKVRLVEKQLGRWVLSWLLSPSGREHIEKVASSTTGLYTLSISKVGDLPVPLPPVAEQTEIVLQIERRLVAAQRLDSTLSRQLERTRTTRQLLLRQGFAGQLVPQDQNDEPASRLLDRIGAERARREAELREARRGEYRTKGSKRATMQLPPPSPENLRAAWQRIGNKTDARRLFDEAGLFPEQVVQFYEALRASPELRTAFEQAAQGRGQKQKPIRLAEEEPKQPKGRFRLVELWLEGFKNLSDYTVRFNPTQGLDVVLGWNGTGKSNLFEALVILFRDLHEWWEKNHWPEKPMNGFRLRYEVDEHTVHVNWQPGQMKRPELKIGPAPLEVGDESQWETIRREQLPLPRFVFGYYSGPTNRLAEHFMPMKTDHYDRLRLAKADDAATLASLLEQRRFFCAETHHAKYVLLGFSYKKDPKINEFLEKRLRIIGFESALFIIRRPPWAKSGSKAEDFWGATGIMRRVMERLSRYAIAPMVLQEKVRYGYRSTTEDHYYFFLPDLASLHAFAAEYQDARTFFLALESTDFSELIHDVKIQVRVKSTNTEQASITFHQLSEGEQQLLMVLGLMRFTKSHQSLVLLDEPDTHLNPHWSVDYVKDLARVMSDNAHESMEQQTSQILMATHDPLVIASLIKEQVHLLKRDAETGVCKWQPASVSPRGLGFTGILTSEMFGFRSDLDPDTLADLDNRVRLVAKEGALSLGEKKELEDIDKRLADAGFSKAFSDPYYAAFVRAWGRRHAELMAGQQFVTPQKRQEIDRIASEVLKEAVAEVEKEVKS